jgi:hypothetical protein
MEYSADNGIVLFWTLSVMDKLDSKTIITEMISGL